MLEDFFPLTDDFGYQKSARLAGQDGDNLDGIVCKRRDSRYQHGISPAFQKVKTIAASIVSSAAFVTRKEANW